MTSLTTFRIELDQTSATYAPGGNVTGRVIVTLSREKVVRGLKISINGKATANWSKERKETDSHGHEETYTDYYTSTEEYINFTDYIVGQVSGDTNVDIPAGYHQYPFNYQLPYNIPSSFEHEIGNIRYTLKATLDRPWKFDHECSTAFIVSTPLDLNLYQEQCLGIDDELDENFCCFCCIDQGSLHGSVKVPSTGYVPGQMINTRITWDNTSDNVEVTKVCTKIQKNLRFKSNSSIYNEINLTTNDCKTSKQGPFNKREDISLGLMVPALMPSHLEFCNIIQLDYALYISIHFSGMHCRIFKTYPLLIGTVPLLSGNEYIEQSLQPTAPLMEYEDRPTPMPAPVSVPMTTSISMPMPMPVLVPPVSPDLLSMPYPYSNLPSTIDFPMPRPNQPIGFNMSDQDEIPTNWSTPPPSYEECMAQTEYIRDRNDRSMPKAASNLSPNLSKK